MEPTVIAIMVFCIAGSAYTSWKIGHTTGIEHALTYLEAEGIIEFEEESDYD